MQCTFVNMLIWMCERLNSSLIFVESVIRTRINNNRIFVIRLHAQTVLEAIFCCCVHIFGILKAIWNIIHSTIHMLITTYNKLMPTYKCQWNFFLRLLLSIHVTCTYMLCFVRVPVYESITFSFRTCVTRIPNVLLFSVWMRICPKFCECTKDFLLWNVLIYAYVSKRRKSKKENVRLHKPIA